MRKLLLYLYLRDEAYVALSLVRKKARNVDLSKLRNRDSD